MTGPIDHPSPDQRALAAMRDHHAALCRGLEERFRALRVVIRVRAEWQRPLVELVSYLEQNVLPHATAEEATLYAVAETDPRMERLVRAMVTEHRTLAETVRRMSDAGSPVEALAAAAATAAVFELHVAKENDLLLPALADHPEVSLRDLHEAMERRLTEAAGAGDKGR